MPAEEPSKAPNEVRLREIADVTPGGELRSAQANTIFPNLQIFIDSASVDVLGRKMNMLFIPYPSGTLPLPDHFYGFLIRHETNRGFGRWVVAQLPGDAEPFFAYRMDVSGDLRPDELETVFCEMERAFDSLVQDIRTRAAA